LRTISNSERPPFSNSNGSKNQDPPTATKPSKKLAKVKKGNKDTPPKKILIVTNEQRQHLGLCLFHFSTVLLFLLSNFLL
jgi:hypothetical protein